MNTLSSPSPTKPVKTKKDMLVFKDKYHLFPENTLSQGFKIDLWGKRYFITSLRYEDEYGRVFDCQPEKKIFW
jgi:hypothetical protein